MKSEDVIVKEKHIKWDKIFYGDDWVNNVVETIRTKDILQSVYLKRYLLRAMMAGFIIGLLRSSYYQLKQHTNQIYRQAL